MKGSEFNVQHIRSILSSKNPNVTIKAFFVVISADSSIKELTSLAEKIKNKKIVTYFDDAITMPEFSSRIQKKCTAVTPQGTRSNILGDIGEETILNSLSGKNVSQWNKSERSNSIVTSDYPIFKSILTTTSFPLNEDITNYSVAKTGSSKKESASYDSELDYVLVNGKRFGKPKTDIFYSVTDEHNNSHNIKLSVKRPSNVKTNVITVHEGSVEQLISDLENTPQNEIPLHFNINELKVALLNFQDVGSKSNMTESNIVTLEKLLPKINDWLIKYFIFGINNKRFNEKQSANCFVTIHPEKGIVYCHSIDETINHLKKIIRQFGTPFSWTYPSKKRGKSIQIKCPIIYD